MGFLDRPVRDGFDEMFDFNHDGNIDPMEFNAQMNFLDDVDDEDDLDDDDMDEDEDDWDDLDDDDDMDDDFDDN